jgi:hypothetical protein
MTFLRRLFGQHHKNNRMLLWIPLVVSILLGFSCSRPSGLFTEASGSPFPVGSSPSSMTVGDFNGDGKPDLAIPNAGNNNATAPLGDGIGGFAEALRNPFAVGKYPRSVAVRDSNGDGKPDLAIVNRDDDNVTVLLNSYSGSGKGRGVSP